MKIEIFVNQIGYLPSQKKFAYARNCKGGEAFNLCSSEGKVLYTGTLQAPVEDRVAAEAICLADFSDFKAEGDFYIEIMGAKSYQFKIQPRVYDDLYFSILNYYYLSRCGQEIDGASAAHGGNSLWSRPACHTGMATVFGTGEKKEVSGGWHDAGDYGRYVVAGTKTVMDILLAYEYSKDKYTNFDILDEARFELEWMLQMQREDGAVYHKISCYHFCAFINPQDEKDEIVLAPVSTAATADFAGCLAYAADFYKATDSAFAEKLLAAALKAQEYLFTHEDELYKNPTEITTGGYGDWNVADERYFALCSLFAATGDVKYFEAAKEIRAVQMAKECPDSEPWKRPWVQNFGWGSVAGYGSEILFKSKDKITDKAFVEDLKKEILAQADKLKNISEKASFGTSVEKLFWGSNGHVCDEAHMLLLAYDLTGDASYELAARKQLNYILGCNPLNICYVTGNGTKSTVHPHHRPTGAMGKVMPGMLAGGPSEGLHDEVAKRELPGKAPLQSYIDHQGSFCTNEIAIYWNSPLVYLVARVGL